MIKAKIDNAKLEDKKKSYYDRTLKLAAKHGDKMMSKIVPKKWQDNF